MARWDGRRSGSRAPSIAAATDRAPEPRQTFPMPVADATPAAPPVKPGLRGVLHLIAFSVTLVAGPALVAAAPSGEPTLAIAIYAVSLSALFGVSALLHRRTWSPEARRVMRRLDHSMIFFLIAGTYTAVAPFVIGGATAVVILLVVWLGGA